METSLTEVPEVPEVTFNDTLAATDLVRCPDCKGQKTIIHSFTKDPVTGYEEPIERDCLTCYNVSNIGEFLAYQGTENAVLPRLESLGVIEYITLIGLSEPSPSPSSSPFEVY